MISPEEIKQKCLSWWKELLISTIDDREYFPKEIVRIGRVTSKDLLSRLNEYKQAIAGLQKYASLWGYKIATEEQCFEKIGIQTVPISIEIPFREVYLQITRKRQEFDTFQRNYRLIFSQLPELKDWCRLNPLKLVSHDSWEDTLKVCRYFFAVPKPNLYIRELPIDVHTKYIEENKDLISSLLDFLLPEITLTGEKNFERRHHLRYAEPLIRIRFLDDSYTSLVGVDDISVPLSTFRTLYCTCRNCLVTENKMNFLTLPTLPGSIAIWSGGGFNISFLKDIDWLSGMNCYYWGDLDAQGFQILNQFRTYYPRTVSLMMDKLTWDTFRHLAKSGTSALLQELSSLLPEEYQLYKILQAGNIRLEQEKIPHMYAVKQIIQAVCPSV